MENYLKWHFNSQIFLVAVKILAFPEPADEHFMQWYLETHLAHGLVRLYTIEV
jgi:hypothetical protein